MTKIKTEILTVQILTKVNTVFKLEQLDNQKYVLWPAFCDLVVFVQHLYRILEQKMLLYSVASRTRGVYCLITLLVLCFFLPSWKALRWSGVEVEHSTPTVIQVIYNTCSVIPLSLFLSYGDLSTSSQLSFNLCCLFKCTKLVFLFHQVEGGISN